MPSNINHWWTTRPKRKLITVVDVLRVFFAVAEGKKWRGDRELHREFENALEKNGLKGEGERRDAQGSGGRTYAAWLYSFGLWFADSEGLVRPTFAGEDLVKGYAPVPILTEQMINFQYPSPFSQITRVDERFKIFPFRFLFNLLLQPKLNGFLTEGEIARFVITKAETDKNLKSVVEAISAYRNSNNDDSAFDESFEQKYKKLGGLKDTANTFINQMEFTQLIERLDGESRIFIPDEKKTEVIKILKKARPLIKLIDGKYENFQRTYGVGPHHQKDTRKFKSAVSVTANQAERSKVLLVLSDILLSQPIKSINADVINQISEKTGVNKRSVEIIVLSIDVKPSPDLFEEKYLQLSVGDKPFATAFEKATAGVFGKDGLGFITKWVGSQKITPDVLAISVEKDIEYLGILDNKATKNYSVSRGNYLSMINDYIPKYSNYKYEDIQTDLAFFSYVAGGFKSTIDKGINSIYQETKIKGSAITAQVLLELLRKHRSSAFTKADFKRIFSLNRQILPTDFNR